ncbi:MAG: hypothetical protein R3C56_03260 [Pirellulaceae bacterium]
MTEVYENPLISRYASREMAELWSSEHRSRLWRKLWIVLAECEQELGLPISDSQLSQLRQFETEIDLAAVADYERRLRHDVMAHVHAYGDQCPDARGIIHWGATSCYVTDNGDLLLVRDGLEMLRTRLIGVIATLADFAKRLSRPTLFGLYALATRSADDRRQTSLFVGLRSRVGSARSATPTGQPASAQPPWERPVRKPAFSSCSRGITTKCGSSKGVSPSDWASREATR